MGPDGDRYGFDDAIRIDLVCCHHELEMLLSTLDLARIGSLFLVLFLALMIGSCVCFQNMFRSSSELLGTILGSTTVPSLTNKVLSFGYKLLECFDTRSLVIQQMLSELIP